VLTAIAQHPNGVTREQLTVLTGYKRSTRDAYLQRMREKHMVNTDGATIIVTAIGLSALGDDFEPLPTGDALQKHWLAKLPEGESRILGQLCAAYPDSVSRDEIGHVHGYARSSRDAYLQRLKARQLIAVVDRGSVRAAAHLF
jgi:chromosome segregation and condensation protein ScpB